MVRAKWSSTYLLKRIKFRVHFSKHRCRKTGETRREKRWLQRFKEELSALALAESWGEHVVFDSEEETERDCFWLRKNAHYPLLYELYVRRYAAGSMNSCTWRWGSDNEKRKDSLLRLKNVFCLKSSWRCRKCRPLREVMVVRTKSELRNMSLAGFYFTESEMRRARHAKSPWRILLLRCTHCRPFSDIHVQNSMFSKLPAFPRLIPGFFYKAKLCIHVCLHRRYRRCQ